MNIMTFPKKHPKSGIYLKRQKERPAPLLFGCNRYRRGADDSCGENIRLEEYQRRYNEAKRMVANQKIK